MSANDRPALTPGPKNLITDVAGLKVGNSDDVSLKSGVTVLTADAPFTAGFHVMGGAPGTRDTDLLAPDKTVEQVDALVLSGGSAFGLDAASGVSAGLRDLGRGFQVGPHKVPITPAAILFDLMNGGKKDWTSNPYPDLGRAALADAGPDFDIGTAGAGFGATTATLKGGLGSASLVLPSGHTVGALVAVNPLGSVTMGTSRHFWAHSCEFGGEFGGLGPSRDFDPSAVSQTKTLAGSSTTIGIVASDATLTKAACTRLATAAHDGFARAIWPSHTPLDGDLVFAAATGEKSTPDIDAALLLGHAAAICMARAIARAVYHATPSENDPLPCWSEL